MIKISTGIGIKHLALTLLITACSTESNVKSLKNTESLILNLILSEEEFQQYLHLDQPNRTPILVATNNNLSLLANPKGFEVILSTSKTSELYINITEFNIKQDQVKFKLDYEIEGVTFEGVATKDIDTWRIKEYSIYES
jgi:hypothetical protein